MITLDSIEQETAAFELAQRKAKVYTSSTLVPDHYRGDSNVGNVLIAMNMANRLGADLLMVMQNLYNVHGKPSWSAQFLIASFNSCGRYSSIHYRFNKDRTSCVAYATELESGEKIESIPVSIEMAKAEGWMSRKGSKWQTNPELMLQYRSATFLVRTHAPELSLGLMTTDEVRDIASEDETPITATDFAAKVGVKPSHKTPTQQVESSDESAEETVEPNTRKPARSRKKSSTQTPAKDVVKPIQESPEDELESTDEAANGLVEPKAKQPGDPEAFRRWERTLLTTMLRQELEQAKIDLGSDPKLDDAQRIRLFSLADSLIDETGKQSE